MSERIWWYESGEKPEGPLTAEELREMIEDGRLSLNTRVWNASMPQWVPASQISELILPPSEEPKKYYVHKDEDQAEPDEQDSAERDPEDDTIEGINQVQPWTRLLARIIDYALCIIFLGPVLVNFTHLISEEMSRVFFVPVLTLFWVFLETAFLSTFGKTPGKYFLGITVTDSQGDIPNQSTAFIRSLNVWVLGMGMGMPIIYIITLYLGYTRLRKNGTTPWDQKAQSVVIHIRQFFSG